MPSIARLLIALLSFPMLAGDAGAGEPTKNNNKKPGRLTTAIGKTNKLVSKFPELDRSIVDASGALKGRFQVAVTILNRDASSDSAYTITGEIIVDSGSAEQFKTREERQDLGAAAKALSNAQSDRRKAVKLFTQQWTRRKKKGGPVVGGGNYPGWYHVRPPYTHITDAEYEQLKTEADRRAKERVDEAQRTLDKLAKPINERISDLKKNLDTVEVEITVPDKVARKIDLVALTKAKTPSLIVTVESFDAENDPEEIGGKLRISKMTLVAVDAAKSLKKKK